MRSIISLNNVWFGVQAKLAETVGPIQETVYGRTWRVESVPDAENIAYTNHELELHTDILYYEAPPGIQLLHCIKQSTQGGENIFADAFQVGPDEMRSVSPLRL